MNKDKLLFFIYFIISSFIISILSFITSILTSYYFYNKDIELNKIASHPILSVNEKLKTTDFQLNSSDGDNNNNSKNNNEIKLNKNNDTIIYYETNYVVYPSYNSSSNDWPTYDH